MAGDGLPADWTERGAEGWAQCLFPSGAAGPSSEETTSTSVGVSPGAFSRRAEPLRQPAKEALTRVAAIEGQVAELHTLFTVLRGLCENADARIERLEGASAVSVAERAHAALAFEAWHREQIAEPAPVAAERDAAWEVWLACAKTWGLSENATPSEQHDFNIWWNGREA